MRLLLILILAATALAGCREPCWTEEVCGPPRRYTYFVMVGKVMVPQTGQTRDCFCPPRLEGAR